MRDVGKNIKQLRLMKNMTQDALAEKLFVTRQTVSNYETGKSRPDIEMLIQIAQALDTDPNTVLYGIPEKINKERMILRICISIGILVAACLGFFYLNRLGMELASSRYDIRLRIFCRLFGETTISFLFAWTAMEVVSVFTKLTPLADPWAKRLRWSVVGVMVGYLLVILLFLLAIGFGLNVEYVLPKAIWDGWLMMAYWITGFLHGAPIRPNVVLFGILGIALWLGIPRSSLPHN